MSASIGDKITDTRNAGRPNSARATGTRSAEGTVLACDNLTGWPVASKVHFVTYQIDSSSKPVAGTQLDCYGIVSGNNIDSFTVVDGVDNGNAVNDVVEMLPTSAWAQDLSDALNTSLNRDGTLLAGIVTASKLAAGAVTTSKLAAGAVTSNEIADGTVGFADLLATIFSGQVQNQTNISSAGGTMFYINLGGIKLLWCNTGNLNTINGNSNYIFTLPTPFFNTIQHTNLTAINPTTTGQQYANLASATTTIITASLESTAIATAGIGLLVIGT